MKDSTARVAATAVAQVINEILSKSPSGKIQMLMYKPDLGGERKVLPRRPRPAVCSSAIKKVGTLSPEAP